MCFLRYDYFILCCFRKVGIPLFDRIKSVFEILPKDMIMKSLDRQLELIALLMVYVAICARLNIAFYRTKLTDFSIQNLAVARVTVAHIGIVI